MGAPVATGASRPSVVTIGNFDGVHVGHRRLIAVALELAARHGWRSVALTFDRHPATVVRPNSAPPLLTDPAHKIELLRATGLEEVVVLPFDEARSKEGAEAFVHEVLAGALGARAVVVGTNFRFGHRQHGDVALLCKLGVELGFEVTAFDLVADDDGRGEPVSSSRIRELLAGGELEHANRLLGRPYRIYVSLERPDGAGRGLVEPGICLPPSGDYVARLGMGGALVPTTRAATVELRGRALQGAALAGFAAGVPIAVDLLHGVDAAQNLHSGSPGA